MYYYFLVAESELDTIRKTGLTTSQPMLDNPDVLDRATTPVLVVPKQAVPYGSTFLAPDLFLNLYPYLPARSVVAAGGYVVRNKNHQREVLLMFRRGAWDLPKGKQDSGETNEETALREVTEEVGAQSLRIVCPLGSTLHGYVNLFKHFFDIKTTYWFLMTADDTPLVAQAEEDIEALEWVSVSELPNRLNYETLRTHSRQWLNALLMAPID
ncbi:MAG TPA: NUDIX hydrolase [Rhodothermales bacterium]|nr:NUDIX hydrolase [Rhodothermales bacterium]HRR09915.1 NUDIX hydrolase [Rhodothermales bacterium]